MNIQDVSALLLALGAGSLLQIALKEFFKKSEQQRAMTARLSLFETVDVHDIMAELSHITRHDRIVIIRLGNHGSTPLPTEEWTITIYYEVKHPRLEAIKPIFKERIPDLAYFKMIEQVLTFGKVAYTDIEGMAPGLLRNLYLSDSVVESRISYIGTTAKGHWLMAMQRHHGSDPVLEAIFQTATDSALSQLRRILKAKVLSGGR